MGKWKETATKFCEKNKKNALSNQYSAVLQTDQQTLVAKLGK